MVNNIPKLGYVAKKVLINANNIKSFVRISEKRKIRTGKVKEICSQLLAGKHFETQLAINRKNNKDDLIDGNHRIMAIEQAIEKDSNFKIEVWIAYYDNLNAEEERKKFETWNVGTKQSSDDFLKVYWDTIPLRKQIEKIPTSIYLSDKKIKVKLLLGSQINAKKEKSFEGGYNAGNLRTVKDFQELDLGDIQKVKAFLSDMTAIFGQFNGKFGFWKSTAISAFYKIWYDNLSIPRMTFVKQFKKVFMGNTQQTWLTQCKSGGREASKLFYTMSLNQLNSAGNLGRHVFV